MWRLLDPRYELGLVSAEVGARLVDTLYPQVVTVIISGGMFVALGLIGTVTTGAAWYLAGAAISGVVCLGRVHQAMEYRRRRDDATTLHWAVGCMRGAWASGALWGGWTVILLFDQPAPLVVMVIGLQATCMIGGAVRHSALTAAAVGQIVLATAPLCVVCALSGNVHLEVFGMFSAWHMYAALVLSRGQYRQIRRLLLADEEKSELVGRLEHAREDLELLNRHLQTLAASDALTGIANRRAFDLAADREWRRMAREQLPLSLLLLDVDHFKAFNDRYGHPAGDTCLRNLAAAMAGALHRPGDFLARYGGEEFAVILPGAYPEEAMIVAENIRQRVLDRDLAHAGSPLGRVTVSIGAACLIPGPNSRVADLKELADAALYAAKGHGRNRAQAAQPDYLLAS